MKTFNLLVLSNVSTTFNSISGGFLPGFFTLHYEIKIFVSIHTPARGTTQFITGIAWK